MRPSRPNCVITFLLNPAKRAGDAKIHSPARRHGCKSMSLLERFDPPAHLPDFYRVPGLAEQWHQAMSSWFDSAIGSEQAVLPAGAIVQFYNPAKYDPGSSSVDQAIAWNGFPKELVRRYGRERAMREADTLWPLSRYSPKWKGPPSLDRTLYRPLNEYCEWHVVRDPDTNKIRKATFSSEPPEYWRALYGGTYDFDGNQFTFSGNPKLVLELYQDFVSSEVRTEDLIAQEDIGPVNGRLLVRKGEYNPYNKWNTTHGIMHLCSPPNSLLEEVQLGADSTVIRRDGRGRIVVEPEALVCCAAYGGPDRNSDPTIGAAVNALARLGAYVTLRNPVGLYMDHIDLAGWSAPDGVDLAACVRIVRGSPGSIERLVLEVPPPSSFTVSDLKIGGVPILYGGQLAECITVKLVGTAILAGVQSASVPCRARCCIDVNHPTMLDRAVLNGQGVPAGKEPAFVNEGVSGQSMSYVEEHPLRALVTTAEAQAQSTVTGESAPPHRARRGYSHRAP